MGFYRGSAGAVWEIDPANLKPTAAESFAERVARGELVEVQADGSDLNAAPAKKAAAVKKAAPKADADPGEG